jgi:hypothetical protein
MPMNMSYCRFENTYEALDECLYALRESMNPLAELSDTERKFANRLIALCALIADDYSTQEAKK